MSGLTRKCKAGDTIQIGRATIRVVKTGRKATINIVAPPDVKIEYQQNSAELAQEENSDQTAEPKS
jgi:hypothetical protein